MRRGANMEIGKSRAEMNLKRSRRPAIIGDSFDRELRSGAVSTGAAGTFDSGHMKMT